MKYRKTKRYKVNKYYKFKGIIYNFQIINEFKNNLVLLLGIRYLRHGDGDRHGDEDADGDAEIALPPIGIGMAEVALCRIHAECVVHTAL